MEKKRLLELAGLIESSERFAVIIKHKGEPAVTVTPYGGVSKDNATQLKKTFMSLKKYMMKSAGRPSDYAEITIKPVGKLKESLLNESISDDFEELKAQINQMKRFGESPQTIKDEFGKDQQGKQMKGDTFIAIANKIIKATKKIQGQM
jgi:3-methyladenine DNA glycosylase/8-oxoguanine DNA glycosylase